ncbi:unnamed protein product [Gulo gulo]|uniref:Uncharacterized protein n=1 Tax=Gulo gulo TaxID=48420 RepID=A0A9X9LFH9_GULGU|nr:unnamed protein product [Gulo gulo]
MADPVATTRLGTWSFPVPQPVSAELAKRPSALSHGPGRAPTPAH